MILDEDNSSSASAFPSLESLKLQDCPELIYSPISLPSLQELHVENCSEAGLRSMVDLKSLKTLRISRISKLIWFPNSFVESLIALEDMKITSCDELRMFPRGKLLTTLKILEIRECEKLESLPEGIL
ncbi:hypothetical protein SLA2020_286990, partial [Shorea laevis]